MSFNIHTVRYFTKNQLVLLNTQALVNHSPASILQEIVVGLDEGSYIVEEAKISPDTQDTVRCKVLVNIGMIPFLWVEIPLSDYRMLPTAEIPGEDTEWDDCELAIQSRV